MEENKFGKNLTRLRTKKKLSQNSLATLLQVSPMLISMYERGIRVPRFDMLFRLADLFEVTIDELVGYQGTKKKQSLEIINKIFQRQRDAWLFWESVGHMVFTSEENSCVYLSLPNASGSRMVSFKNQNEFVEFTEKVNRDIFDRSANIIDSVCADSLRDKKTEDNIPKDVKKQWADRIPKITIIGSGNKGLLDSIEIQKILERQQSQQ